MDHTSKVLKKHPHHQPVGLKLAFVILCLVVSVHVEAFAVNIVRRQPQQNESPLWANSEAVDDNAAATGHHLKSHDLHLVAMPRHKAVGMWLPEQTHLDKIRRHRHSIYLSEKRKSTHKSALDLNETLIEEQGSGWIDLPQAGPGPARMNADELRGYVVLDDGVGIVKRLGPAVSVAIKALGPLIEFIGNTVCTFLAKNGAKTVSKVACFLIVNILGLGTIWGSFFSFAPFQQQSGAIVSAITAGANSVMQAINPRDVDISPWYQDHMPKLQDLYKESLFYDDLLIKSNRAVYDKHTGQMLTNWDIIMSHIHPLEHSFIKGLNATIWHESTDTKFRKHVYSPLEDGASYHLPGYGLVQNVSFTFPSTLLNKRQCVESDTEAGEPPAEEYCEEGSSVGKGIYNGYDFTGTETEADDAHLTLGNDTYLQEVAQLEGDLMYLGSVEAVCENITDTSNGNKQFYIGLRQFEGPGDNYIGYEDCQDVHA